MTLQSATSTYPLDKKLEFQAVDDMTCSPLGHEKVRPGPTVPCVCAEGNFPVYRLQYGLSSLPTVYLMVPGLPALNSGGRSPRWNFVLMPGGHGCVGCCKRHRGFMRGHSHIPCEEQGNTIPLECQVSACRMEFACSVHTSPTPETNQNQREQKEKSKRTGEPGWEGNVPRPKGLNIKVPKSVKRSKQK